MVQSAGARRPRTAVAIPARNEAERVAACLLSLNAQLTRPDHVLLLVNNSNDETKTIARSLRDGLRYSIEVVARDLPDVLSSAGHARRLAMDLAAGRLAPDDVLLTTDADSIAPSDWIARNLQALAGGADVVCGRAELDAREAALLPVSLRTDEATEARLIALLDAIALTLDPEAHDPWPRHTEASGASLAVRAGAYHRVGGIPPVANGEDRAFVRALWMMDARVRHDPAIAVTVSGRLDGRAADGMAATLRRRMQQRDEFADPLAEPAADGWRRCALRGRARLAWRGRPDAALARDLALPARMVASALDNPFFGAAWATLEAASSVLARRLVRFAELPCQIAEADSILRRLCQPETLAAD